MLLTFPRLRAGIILMAVALPMAFGQAGRGARVRGTETTRSQNQRVLRGRVPDRQFIPDRYLVILQDAPVAARFQGVGALRSSAAEAYRQQVEGRQRDVIRAIEGRNFRVTGAVTQLGNALLVSGPRGSEAELRSVAGVADVRQRRVLKYNLNAAVQLMNGPAAWNVLGGQSNAGKGMKIAVIDSGIDQTHPAFQDSSLNVPAGFPKCNAVSDCVNFTNNKVIVARSYVTSFTGGSDPNNPAVDSTPDDASARDRQGHGTAVASAAAGNAVTGSVALVGMAPKAWLGSYKVGGSPGVNDGSDEGAMVLALEDAVKDGMDVIVVASGAAAVTGPLDKGADCGLSGDTPCDYLAYSFENAAKAGAMIVASAGNQGQDSPLGYPNPASISSPANAPSVLGVGATTNSHVLVPTVSITSAGAPATLQNIPAVLGDSYSVLYAYSIAIPESGTLVDMTSLGNDGLACTALPANSLAGKYALIARGTCNFAVKAQVAQDAGAYGVIIYNNVAGAPFGPGGVNSFTGTVVMVSNADGLALKSYLSSNAGAQVTIDLAGAEQDIGVYSTSLALSPALAANQLASYSSIGPVVGTYALKPDMVATGGLDVQLFYRQDWPDSYLPAAPGTYLATQKYDAMGSMWSPNGYAAADGTSFAAPLAGGAAALVKQAHPDFNAADIRSALVNSAGDVTADDFGNTVRAESVGAGRLDAGAAVKATVTASPATLSFGVLKTGATLPSVPFTLTNRGPAPVTLTLAVVVANAATGITVNLDKTSVTLPAGSGTVVTASLTGTAPAAVGNYSGTVTVQGTNVSMRIPYLFSVGNGVAFNIPEILGSSFGIAGHHLGYWILGVTDAAGVAVENSPVQFTVSPRNSLTLASVPGQPACTIGAGTATCPTNKNGYAWLDITLGAAVADSSVTISAAGARLGPYTVSAIAQPTISAGGVLPAAYVDAGTPIAPGSYIAIYGTGLSEYLDVATGTTLPMSLDGVTVSFDVPSAKLSLPGRIVFVSPNQVDVQVPWELKGQSSVQMKVTLYEGLFGNVVTVPLADYTPSFFHATADALDVRYGVINSSNPAKRGEIVQLFVNGLGPVSNQPASGDPAGVPLSETPTKAQITVGGVAADVGFSGLAPGFPGLYQVNFTMPSNVTPGSAVPISLSIGGKTAKQATIPVQ